MDDADGGNGKYECAGTQESRKRDKLLQFTLLLKNGLVHAMRSTGPHQPSFHRRLRFNSGMALLRERDPERCFGGTR
jgi:hypothetical protein